MSSWRSRPAAFYDFEDKLAGTMRPDAASQQRIDDIILPALRSIADQAERT